MSPMSEQNRELIRELYAALDAHDGERMAACYAPNARFRDPAFGQLDGEEVAGMWRMLCSRTDDLAVELPQHDADESTGTAHWIARYTFSTGRPVVNDIRARFRFENGKIADHVDEFDFSAWAAQALGLAGKLPGVRFMVRWKARRDLASFLKGG